MSFVSKLYVKIITFEGFGSLSGIGKKRGLIKHLLNKWLQSFIWVFKQFPKGISQYFLPNKGKTNSNICYSIFL